MIGRSNSDRLRGPLKRCLRELIIDGEATVVGNTGLPDFQALRRELAKSQSERLIYQAFDLLYLDGIRHARRTDFLLRRR